MKALMTLSVFVLNFFNSPVAIGVATVSSIIGFFPAVKGLLKKSKTPKIK